MRRSPSPIPISGSQPSTWCARVMSGWRTCGSSTGSASNTISLFDDVTRMTVCAISSRLSSVGLPRLTGRCFRSPASDQ